MLRFDLLSREKKAISRIIGGVVGRDLIACFIGLENAWGSMKQTLEFIEISTKSPLGKLKVHGMLVVYLKSICSWLKDDSIDLEKTMADLDKYLTRAETLLCSVSLEKLENDIKNS